jgi:hypothetical protein
LRLPNLHLDGEILLFKSTSIDQTEPLNLLIGRLIFSSPYRKMPLNCIYRQSNLSLPCMLKLEILVIGT